MKTLLIVAVLALAVPCVAFGQAAAPAKSLTAEQEVSALERAWYDASRKYDVAWFERYLADTVVLTDEEGAVTGKAAQLADVKNHANTYDSLSYEDLKVQVYGDTAIATGITVFKGTSKGKAIGGRTQWTDTWIKRGGQWQCVASQGTFITKK
jgi:ketosteroid isomerase-like protein